MMPVNPAYRDFFKALDAIAHGADPWAAYERDYLRRHRAVIEAYWRQCWGADERRVRDMAREIHPQDYRALRDSLAAHDVSRSAAGALQRCAALADLAEPEVDLLVGRFSPDAFLLRVGKSWHIGVGLERFAHFAALPLYIAHEYGHYARRMLAPEPQTLGDAIVGEGVAVAFAEAAYPESPLARHLRMSPRRIHEVRQMEAELWAALKPCLASSDLDAFAGVLYGACRWRDYPPRFGSSLGYWAVRHFAQALGAAGASRTVLAAASAAIIDSYLGRTVGRAQ